MGAELRRPAERREAGARVSATMNSGSVNTASSSTIRIGLVSR